MRFSRACINRWFVCMILGCCAVSFIGNVSAKKVYGIQIIEQDDDVVVHKSTSKKSNDPDPICRACPAGSFSNAGNAKCADCSPGWCSNVTFCIVCPAGTYSDRSNSTACTTCPDGFVTRNQNMTKCNACPAGQTSSSTHTSCPACPPGYNNPKPGGICLPCPRGQFQTNYGGYNCTLCPPASWNDQIGQPVCVNCGQGRWGVAVGASTPDVCSDCPEGYYCPQPRTTKPLPCPSDNYCDKGSSSPSSCPFLFQSPAISTTCRPSTYFYLIFAGLGGLILVFAVVVWFTVSHYRSKKKKKAKPPKGRSEVESLIPEPLPGPVYNGL